MLETDHKFVQRLQSSGNYLLVKDDVGAPKPTIRNLPPQEFTYGKRSGNDQEGVGALIGSWDSVKPKARPLPEKDFKKLNAMSVKQKQCTST